MAAVSPSWGGPGVFPHRYEAGVRQLESEFGVRVVEMPLTRALPEELAADPAGRAADLMAAFADPSIRGIVSSIGGDDSVRLIPHLDLDLIRANPKIFLGYSDASVCHFACHAAGLVSFYGPTIMAGFGENAGLFPYMVDSVRRTLFQTEPVGVIEANRGEWCVEPLDWSDPENQTRPRKREAPLGWRWLQGSGVAEGRLLGGCLDVLEFLRGTPLWPPLEAWRGAILFFELSEEAPTPETLRRWLRGYASMGVLEGLVGIMVGRPGGNVAIEDFAAYDRVLLDVVAGEAGRRELPIVSCMDFGHSDPMFVLPLGVRARIDCERREIGLSESAVTAR